MGFVLPLCNCTHWVSDFLKNFHGICDTARPTAHLAPALTRPHRTAGTDYALRRAAVDRAIAPGIDTAAPRTQWEP